MENVHSVYVFHRDGQPISNFDYTWKKACKEVNLAGRRFHDFRRTAVRDMMRARLPEKVIMSITGHRTRSIFDRYNIIKEIDQRDYLGRIFGQ